MTVFKQHHGVVTDLDLHPLGTHFLSVSGDGVWSFSDIVHGKALVKVSFTFYKKALAIEL